MNTMNKVASARFGVAALGAALLTSGPAKASCDQCCDQTQYLVGTSPNQAYYAYDQCGKNDGSFSYLSYSVAFIPHSSGGPMSGYGFGSNQIEAYFSQGPTNSGYYDGVFLNCANEGWIDSGWQGPFYQVFVPPGGGYPPSAFKFCNNSGDAAGEVEGYVWLQ
jgi:hypothetical protein